MEVKSYYDNVILLFFLVLLPESCGSSFAGYVQTCGAWRGVPSCGKKARRHAQLAEGITTSLEQWFSTYKAP